MGRLVCVKVERFVSVIPVEPLGILSRCSGSRVCSLDMHPDDGRERAMVVTRMMSGNYLLIAAVRERFDQLHQVNKIV